MRRKFVLFICVVLTLCMFAGCSANGKSVVVSSSPFDNIEKETTPEELKNMFGEPIESNTSGNCTLYLFNAEFLDVTGVLYIMFVDGVITSPCGVYWSYTLRDGEDFEEDFKEVCLGAMEYFSEKFDEYTVLELEPDESFLYYGIWEDASGKKLHMQFVEEDGEKSIVFAYDAYDFFRD